MGPYDPQAAHPSLGLHIADASALPILSSSGSGSGEQDGSGSRPSSPALTKLTTTYLSAHDIASRFGHGALQRVWIETDGAVTVMQSYVESPSSPKNAVSTTEECGGGGGVGDGGARRVNTSLGLAPPPKRHVSGGTRREDGKDADRGPPSLVTTVVAPSEARVVEARRAQNELRMVAKAFQRAWAGESTTPARDDDRDARAREGHDARDEQTGAK